MNLQTEQYLTQSKRWPASGRHILAQFDAETVSGFVAEQRTNAESNGFGKLVTPREDVYPVANQEIVARLGIERCD